MTANLKPLRIDPASITVSGVSSGAMMAVQLHLAHSLLISGVGIIAGGPYGCANGSALTATQACMSHPDKVDTKALLQKINTRAETGELAPIRGLDHDAIYIFSSPADKVVNAGAGLTLRDQYHSLAPSARILLNSTTSAAHGWPTLADGANCNTGGAPYILNCGFDLAGEMLSHLYLNLKNRTTAKPENLFTFSASEFNTLQSKTNSDGAIYIPTPCQANNTNSPTCRLHIALHGCHQSPEFVGDQFERTAGLNEWAEDNEIVVLYPKTTVSTMNPYGCWDWFGYTGADYDTKSGAQIKVLRAMVERLTGL